jgi:hypothetical protein
MYKIGPKLHTVQHTEQLEKHYKNMKTSIKKLNKHFLQICITGMFIFLSYHAKSLGEGTKENPDCPLPLVMTSQ